MSQIPQSLKDVKACSIEGCEKAGPFIRSWCHMHWLRWRRNGDPLVTLKHRGSLFDRLFSKITKTDTCWIWTGAKNPAGYGHLGFNGRTKNAHKAVYELLIGPVPEGLTLDHLCRVHNCVNPAHLEPVTQLENYRRGTASAVTRERHRARRERLATA